METVALVPVATSRGSHTAAPCRGAGASVGGAGQGLLGAVALRVQAQPGDAALLLQVCLLTSHLCRQQGGLGGSSVWLLSCQQAARAS